ncbi:MAG: hypothetical protein WCJ30_11925 [Deltaproteobacteria bacterium]
MKPPAVLAPIAILGGACTLRPFTPSTTLVTWAEHVPAAVQQTAPTSDQAIAAWQLPPDLVWSRFAKNTLLSSLDIAPVTTELPDVARLDVVRQAQCAARHAANLGLPEDLMWIVDLRGAASVAFGSTLSRRATEPVAPVITFNNWPAETEAVPAEETLAALLGMTPRLLAPGTPRAIPVLLLDAWRLAFRYESFDDDIVDNRYALTSADLPSAELLASQGIRRIAYLVERLDETEVEEDDMTSIVADYAAHGIVLAMVDLESLCEPQGGSISMEQLVARHRWHFTPRLTLLEEPAFFERARGGFGAVHSGPSPFRVGHGFSMAPHGHRAGGGGGGGGGPFSFVSGGGGG